MLFFMRLPKRLRLLVLVLVAGCSLILIQGCDDDDDETAAPVAEERTTPPLPAEYRPQEGEFVVVYLPDTQVYSDDFPETFVSQTKWIAEYADEYNIVFVSHVGDVVNNGDSDREWSNAVAAMAWLDDIDMPYGISFASHDETRGRDRLCDDFEDPRCRAAKYLEHFGPQKFEGKPWFGGASPSGTSNYQVVEAEGMKLLFLHLPQDTPRAEIEWAHEVLDANPGTLAHFITHRYLFDYRLTDWLPVPLNVLQAGRFFSLVYNLGGQGLKYETSVDTYTLFDDLVATHPNIWSVHCGHVDGEFNQEFDNQAGLPVYENLIDFQDMADGGGGWLRVLRYRPALNQVQAITFSTVTGWVRETGAGFEHSIDIVDSYRKAYANDLSTIGITQEFVESLLNRIRTPGQDRDEYYESLYGRGKRNSTWTIDVDFQAYIDASR